MTYTNIGFALAIEGHEDEYPLLARALANAETAHSLRVEWIDSALDDDGDVRLTANFNYCQITRTSTVEEHLKLVESCLRDGSRYQTDSTVAPHRYMGGVIELLGREPSDSDYISLRVLRDLVEHEYEDFWDPDRLVTDYISEVSVIAKPTVLVAA